MGPDISEAAAGPIQALVDDRLIVNAGLWLVHRLTLNMTVRQYKLMWMCMVRLRLVNLDPDFASPTDIRPVQPMPDAQYLKDLLHDLPFERRYLVEALLSHVTVTMPETGQLLQALSRYRHEDQIVILEDFFKCNRKASVKRDLRDVARRVARSRTAHAYQHFVLIRRCLITPAHCILYPPSLETSNEMLRDHAAYSDRFLRVQFVDHDGDFPVTGDTLLIDDDVFGLEGVFVRVRRALADGLVVAGQHHVFANRSGRRLHLP